MLLWLIVLLAVIYIYIVYAETKENRPNLQPKLDAANATLYGASWCHYTLLQLATLQQMASFIASYQLDPDSFKHWSRSQLKIMGLNPEMAKGLAGATKSSIGYIPKFKYKEGTGEVWSAGSGGGNWINWYVYRYGRSYGGMFNVSNIRENAIKNGHLQTLVLGEMTEPTTFLEASMANEGTYWGWHSCSTAGCFSQSLDNGPKPMGKAYLSTWTDYHANDYSPLTCDDVKKMQIPTCAKAKVVGKQCNQASVPYLCYQNNNSPCPNGYEPIPMTCGTSPLNAVCKRKFTKAYELTPYEQYECCSGLKQGAINCASDYCVAGKDSGGNTQTKCNLFLPEYCSQKATAYPMLNGKPIPNKSTWLKNITPATDTTGLTFLSDKFPGCGCNDPDYETFTKAKYKAVKFNTKEGGGEIDFSQDVSPQCWFEPCSKIAENPDYRGAPNCTFSFCAAVQANTITGAGDKKLVNTCTASATTKTTTNTKTAKANSTADATTSLANSIASLAATEAIKKGPNNTTNTNLYMYIGIGAGVFVLLVILVMLFRK